MVDLELGDVKGGTDELKGDTEELIDFTLALSKEIATYKDKLSLIAPLDLEVSEQVKKLKATIQEASNLTRSLLFSEQVENDSEHRDTQVIQKFLEGGNGTFKELMKTIFNGQKMHEELSSALSTLNFDGDGSFGMMSIDLMTQWAKKAVETKSSQEATLEQQSSLNNLKQLHKIFQTLSSGMTNKINAESVWDSMDSEEIVDPNIVKVTDKETMLAQAKETWLPKLKETWLAQVKSNGLLLEKAPSYLKDDEEIVGAAYNQNSASRQFASEHLQKSIDENIQAVQNGEKKPEDVPNFLKGNLFIYLNAIYAETITVDQIPSDAQSPELKRSCNFMNDFKKTLKQLQEVGESSNDTKVIVAHAYKELDSCLKNGLTQGAQWDNEFKINCVNIINKTKEELARVALTAETQQLIDRSTITLANLKAIIFIFIKNTLPATYARQAASFLLKSPAIEQLDEIKKVSGISSADEKRALNNPDSNLEKPFNKFILGEVSINEEKSNAAIEAKRYRDAFNGRIDILMNDVEPMLLELQLYKRKHSSKMLPEEEYYISSAIKSYNELRDCFVEHQDSNEGEPFQFIEKLTTALCPMFAFAEQLHNINNKIIARNDDMNKLNGLGAIIKKNLPYATYMTFQKTNFKDWLKVDQSPDLIKMDKLFDIVCDGVLKKELEGKAVWGIIHKAPVNDDTSDEAIDAIKGLLTSERASLLEKRAEALRAMYKEPDEPYKKDDKKELMKNPDFFDNAKFFSKLSRRVNVARAKAKDLSALGDEEGSKSVLALCVTIDKQVNNVLDISKTGDRDKMREASRLFKKECGDAINKTKDSIKAASESTTFLDRLMLAITGVITLLRDNEHHPREILKVLANEVSNDSTEEIIDEIDSYLFPKPK